MAALVERLIDRQYRLKGLRLSVFPATLVAVQKTTFTEGREGRYLASGICHGLLDP